MKLLKRKIVCLVALNQFKNGQTCLENLIELSNNVYKISLDSMYDVYNLINIFLYYK